ncbi:hypothetical protein G6F65_013622 [Rhizopus arrhizus]|nr:hypothetical protein G6F65_013622 [Rhizopus arrhizus]
MVQSQQDETYGSQVWDPSRARQGLACANHDHCLRWPATVKRPAHRNPQICLDPSRYSAPSWRGSHQYSQTVLTFPLRSMAAHTTVPSTGEAARDVASPVPPN